MSDKPDLTLDQPAQAGWLRAEFYGDTEAAKGYLFEARRQLGAMRARYGVNLRIANGEPGGYFRDYRILPDGTQIDVMTNDGHDTVRITAPPPPTSSHPEPEYTPPESPVGTGMATSYEDTPEVPQPHEEPLATTPEKFQTDGYAVCGFAQDADGNLFLFQWTPDDGFTDVPYMTGYYYGLTARLSEDGEVVCGYMGGDDDEQAFYWTRKQGSLPLGVEFNSHATGVAAGGNVFCGWGDGQDSTGHSVPRAYRWTLQPNGEPPLMESLPLPNDVIDATADAISAGGNWIAGSILAGNGFGAYVRQVVLWSKTNEMTTLPDSGLGVADSKALQYLQHWTTYDTSGGIISQFTETYYPGTPRIAGTPGVPGRVEFSDGSDTQSYDGVWPSYPYSIATRPVTGGGPTSYGSDAMTGTERVVTWEVPWEMVAAGVSDSGVVCGTLRPPASPDVLLPKVFRWSAQDGLQILGDGEAHGISADGGIIVGHRNSVGSYVWFMWTAKDGMVAVGPGRAYGAASATFSDGTDSSFGTLLAGCNSADETPGMMAVVRTPPDIDGNYTETQLGYGRGGVSSFATDITVYTEEYDL